jgi:endonuclease/exonuclease/phosphatase family metal-dependent hydrolase
MDYLSKYRSYKEKYLRLKGQRGGGTCQNPGCQRSTIGRFKTCCQACQSGQHTGVCQERAGAEARPTCQNPDCRRSTVGRFTTCCQACRSGQHTQLCQGRAGVDTRDVVDPIREQARHRHSHRDWLEYFLESDRGSLSIYREIAQQKIASLDNDHFYAVGSDHLPVIATHLGLRLVSFNLLKDYGRWHAPSLDSQGLPGLKIDPLIRFRRNLAVLLYVLSDADRYVVALQEFDVRFMEHLRIIFGSKCHILTSPYPCEQVLLIPKTYLVKSSPAVRLTTPWDSSQSPNLESKKYFNQVEICDPEGHEKIQIANVHLPGVPEGSLRSLKEIEPLVVHMISPRVVMGDFNVTGATVALSKGWPLERVKTLLSATHKPPLFSREAEVSQAEWKRAEESTVFNDLDHIFIG